MKPFIMDGGGNIPYNCYPKCTHPGILQLFKFLTGDHLPSSQPDGFSSDQDPSTYHLTFEVKATFEKLSSFDVLPCAGSGCLLMNQRTVNLVNSICPEDVQFFPTVILNSDSSHAFETRDYFMLNICRVEDVIDEKLSVLYHEDNNRVRNIKKLIFRESDTLSYGLARSLTFRPIMVASHEVAKAFKKNKIRGIKFVTDQEAY